MLHILRFITRKSFLSMTRFINHLLQKRMKLLTLFLTATLTVPRLLFAQAELIISEMHYNQPGSDTAEFIEIQNISDLPIDLGGYQFTRGVTYTFPSPSVLGAGEYFVLATPNNNFSIIYPGVPIKGIYADDDLPASYPGAISGGGESITLIDNLGNIVMDFRFDDNEDLKWPKSPDGGGFTLVPYRTDGLGDPEDPDYWIPSINAYGSPGQAEPNPGVPPIYINEIRTRDGNLNNDSIELYNPNNVAVNIGHWWLGDGTGGDTISDDRKGYRIPANTFIPANGYLVLNEITFGFGLSSQGEMVYLNSGNAAGQLTGYVHGFHFKSAANQVTFGRYINSDGIEQFPPQISNTLGGPNSGPRVSNVVITEIMYNPINGMEYIELQNTGGSTVNLYDPLVPANRWQILGFGFEFPNTNPTIAPGEVILVINTNTTAFLAAHDVPAGVTIYPQATGGLSNGGELIELARTENLDPTAPSTPATNVVDEVAYDDDGNWPSEPDGLGASLTRRALDIYGSESSAWRASVANGGSPGWNTAYNGPAVFVNEALTHTDIPRVDAIELLNTNANPVDISGWYLSDDTDNPQAFKIPNGTTIAGNNGLWAVNEDNDGNPNNNASLPAGYFGRNFSLSSRGESVYLYSATPDGRLSGYRHGFDFNASENGVSFGRHVDSDGEEHFVPQLGISIQQNISVPNPAGQPNLGPLIGPVVINEIFYEPLPGQVEFIELLNRTSTTIKLYDDDPAGNPNNNWGITNGVSMILPGTRPTLGAGEKIIILPFGTDAAGFRTANAVPASVVIHGGANGYLGALRNGGERITLMRPDKPDEVPEGSGNFIIPWIDVDTIEYDDEAPWPNIGNNGNRSIERINPASFTDETINWRVSNPVGGTPGDDVSTGLVYDSWALNTFTRDEIALTGTTGPNDDFNNDGFPNVESYARGLDPRVTITPESLSSEEIMNSDGQNYLVLSHIRGNQRNDILWFVERTDDLLTNNWTPANDTAIAPVDHGNNTSTWFARDTFPITDRQRSYLHVGYELVAP